MRKEIQAYGNSSVIVLTKADMKVYGLKQGDILELTITEVINNKSDCFASSQPSHKSKKQHTQTRKEKSK